MAGPLETKGGELKGKVSYKIYNYHRKQTRSYLDPNLSHFYKDSVKLERQKNSSTELGIKNS